MIQPGMPQRQGLYDPQSERDACGVGFICSLKGEKSHGIVHDAIRILANLRHRGATGCDCRTGDGAGILMQMPHSFFNRKCEEIGIRLPDPGDYGVGMILLPRDPKQNRLCIDIIENIVRKEGQELLGWRDVPANSEAIGDRARQSEPVVRQVFIRRGENVRDAKAFERKLFLIRKISQHRIYASNLPQRAYYHPCSFSSNTIVYKGLFVADQLEEYYADLTDPAMASGVALVHSRYSTNTFPTWNLAQPFRFMCHNGEINTVRGNVNYMLARQGLFKSDLFGNDMPKLFPVVMTHASDSAILDNAVELLYHTGRSLPHVMMMLIPEAWQNHETMSDEKKAFYEYHSCLMEPWDGPASIPFTDGHCIGAVLDRNGLRPSRYLVTRDGRVIMSSETGVLDIDPANIEYKGRLQPGRMFLVDTDQGRIVDDEEIKSEIGRRKPYRVWLNDNLVDIESLPTPAAHATDAEPLHTRQRLFGYTTEDLKIIIGPMAQSGQEPTGSMGNDAPLAVLSDRPQLLYNYFKQLFAQVTNPPLDAIRERIVTSLITNIGAESDLFQETPQHCRQIRTRHPILTSEELSKLKALQTDDIRSAVLPMLFPVSDGPDGLEAAMNRLRKAASQAIDDGCSVLILSDRGTDRNHAPIPALLAAAGVHHHLVREKKRTRCGLVVESGEPREVHHFALLFAYGVSAINPYLAFDSIAELIQEGTLKKTDLKKAVKEYIKAAEKGVLKVMSKMGVSTLQSYRGAQIMEAVGLDAAFIDKYLPGTASRVGGIGIDAIAAETFARHEQAYPKTRIAGNPDLDSGGQYQWRRNGEYHLFNPLTIAKLQQATRDNDPKTYEEYSKLINDQSRALCTLRGMLKFLPTAKPVPLDEVEPWTEIVKRFKTGAMSYGSISQEAHETLAIAMNRLGGKSNSGEGGEDAARFVQDPGGDSRNSAIKQVASGRFGVTNHYLVNATELQIKMAQGAKPGEGGQLPGEKVYPWIARVRHSTPYVQLISPPPHHDIYSIEDLAQLIHDLKNANSDARVTVKLVAEAGVGVVAAGVSKGKADVVLISGHDGGTGASPQTSIKHAGLPWELGLAETHQTLVLNDLRSRIRVECDGQLKTGRDVAIACLLGAEEFGFATAPLVVTGCIMMRKCHLNTCPVGVATQDPVLRKKFSGKPEHVINYFHFVAEELRRIMASLGFRTIEEMVGHVEKLEVDAALDHWKARKLDFTKILYKPQVPAHISTHCTQTQDHGLKDALDHTLIKKAKPALERGENVVIDLAIRNINRTFGTMLSSEISRRYGENGLPDDTITINAKGAAGQSFMAFGSKGITVRVEGDGNDYFCKGLSGAKVIIHPPATASFIPEKNIIIGNVALYGATSGELYVHGIAGERFCVRNSGARAVVEGVGDHGCEYMTGGCAVILGPTGRNFAAGMSGGVAYVLDLDRNFGQYRCNKEMVQIERVVYSEDVNELRELIENHHRHTRSTIAKHVLEDWKGMLGRFVKVMPIDYRRALERIAREQKAQKPAVKAESHSSRVLENSKRG